jgi:ABC-type sugar transport system permease subunit
MAAVNQVRIRKYLSTEKKKSLVGFVYVLPFYVLFLTFGLYPIFSGFYLSFFRWDGVSIMRFLGLENYKNVVTDRLFWKGLSNSLIMGVGGHIPVLFGGLIMAYILNSKIISFQNVFKTLYFMPMVTSSVAASMIFQLLFGYNFGVINAFFGLFGAERINWLTGDGSNIKFAVMTMFSWKWMGWNMVIYLSGMQAISEDIYEAATIDGANHKQMFFRITIPLLKPIILFTLVTSSIGMFNLFTEPFILTNSNWMGGPNNGALTAMMYLLNKAPQGGNAYGYASATAYVIVVFVMIFTFCLTRVMREKD